MYLCFVPVFLFSAYVEGKPKGRSLFLCPLFLRQSHWLLAWAAMQIKGETLKCSAIGGVSDHPPERALESKEPSRNGIYFCCAQFLAANGNGSKSCTPSEHPNPTTKRGSKIWVVNSPTKMGSDPKRYSPPQPNDIIGLFSMTKAKEHQVLPAGFSQVQQHRCPQICRKPTMKRERRLKGNQILLVPLPNVLPCERKTKAKS